MDTDPKIVEGLYQSFFLLVWDHLGSMPPNASVQHMEDNILSDKQKVTLNFFIELVRNLNTALVAWAWLGPLPANMAGLRDFWDQIKNLLRYPHSVKEFSHGVL